MFWPENMIFFRFGGKQDFTVLTENNFAFLVEKREFAVILQLWLKNLILPFCQTT